MFGVDYKQNNYEMCKQNKHYNKCSFVNDPENKKETRKCCKTCKKITKYAMIKKDLCKLSKDVCCKQKCCRPGPDNRFMFDDMMWWDWDQGWF